MPAPKPKLISKSKPLKSIRTLIADGDEQMASVLSKNLGMMGFGEVIRVKDGSAVVEALKSQSFDLLITEWPMEPMDGIALVRKLRRDAQLQTRRMPIIMLTGKAEKADVEAARDSGITEFLIKPFTSQALFDRLERLVESPLPFVLTPAYVGPDRRRKNDPVNGEDRRKIVPTPVTTLATPPDEDAHTPRILPPDTTLKRRILLGETLSSLIIPEVIEQAQAAIDALGNESLHWMRDDLGKMGLAYKRLVKNDLAASKDLKDSALSIKSRAGTFGFHAMSETARLLYRFVSGEYKAGEGQHNTILLTHIEALKIIFGGCINGKGDDASYHTLARELDSLVARYRALG